MYFFLIFLLWILLGFLFSYWKLFLLMFFYYEGCGNIREYYFELWVVFIWKKECLWGHSFFCGMEYGDYFRLMGDLESEMMMVTLDFWREVVLFLWVVLHIYIELHRADMIIVNIAIWVVESFKKWFLMIMIQVNMIKAILTRMRMVNGARVSIILFSWIRIRWLYSF